MNEYTIDVRQIEELQNISNVQELKRIFSRAKTTIVNGEKVCLVRKEKNGQEEKFDELTTLEDLETYRKRVFMYLEEK